MKRIILSLSLLLLAFFSYSQSLEETLSWVKGKLNNSYYQWFFDEYKVQFDYNLKDSTIQIYHFIKDDSNIYQLYYYLDVPLKTLSANINYEIKQDVDKNEIYWININSIDNKYVFPIRWSYDSNLPLYADAETYLGNYKKNLPIPVVMDLREKEDNICYRLKKAFSHAIKLGGGKEEVF